ncbi:UNKNOWN [Stylonychia lemnae]|uniref:Transmembrane protein n=1 Tax=Stylonychia lemnae TaxID=5949 RepID=A0A078AWX5_STYLE|nr:UNKNOWN [Stylonychia lemnae]|eukprot:CDW86669.1 UNKNOWN [Stylonychia lemnae]
MPRCVKLANIVQSCDQFGHTISLKYKNKPTHKSLFGGVISILYALSIFIFLMMQLKRVVERDNTIQITSYRRNVISDQIEYHMTFENFDIAYRLMVKNKTIEKNLERYVKVSMGVFIQEWKDDFYISNFVQFPLKIPGIYYCPDILDFKLSGLLSSKITKQFQIQVERCDSKNQTCESEKEIDFALDQLEMSLVMLNQIPDVNDFSNNPIKTQLKLLYATTASSVSQTFEVRLSQNFMVFSDSWFSNQMYLNNITYYSIKYDINYSGKYQYGNSVLTYYILFDEQVTTTIRQNYTIADALVSTGGLIGVIQVFLIYLTSFIQEQLFEFNILSELYQIDSKYDLSQSLKIPKTNSIKENSQIQKYDFRLKGLMKNIKNRVGFLSNLIEYQELQDKTQMVNTNNQQSGQKNKFGWMSIPELQRKQLKSFLNLIIKNSDKSEIDKRILKNLEHKNQIKQDKRSSHLLLLKKNFLANLNQKLDQHDQISQSQTSLFDYIDDNDFLQIDELDIKGVIVKQKKSDMENNLFVEKKSSINEVSFDGLKFNKESQADITNRELIFDQQLQD